MLSDTHQALLRDLNTSLSTLEDDEAVMIMCNGKLPDGMDFYAFVNIKAARLVDFYDSVREEKEIRLGDFGEVVCTGSGLEPPPEIRQKALEGVRPGTGRIPVSRQGVAGRKRPCF